jgi:hypothetical protein
MLAKRVGDIQPQQLAAQFWNGTNRYLWVKWAEAGYDPESSSFDKLVMSAERFELSEQI